MNMLIATDGNRVEYNPEDHYPPIGTEEACLIVSLDCDTYRVLGHTGRAFHGQIECAGYNGEELGLQNVPEEPGYWVMERGSVHASEDEFEIDGDWRPAVAGDFDRFNADMPDCWLEPQCRVQPVAKPYPEPRSIEVTGNNGGSYVRLTEVGRGMAEIEVGETCVVTVNQKISVSALAAILTSAKDKGFQSILDDYSNRGGTAFKVDEDHWTLKDDF